MSELSKKEIILGFIWWLIWFGSGIATGIYWLLGLVSLLNGDMMLFTCAPLGFVSTLVFLATMLIADLIAGNLWRS